MLFARFRHLCAGQAFESRATALRTLLEIRLLKHLQHSNLVSLRALTITPFAGQHEDVYMVYKLMDTDMQQLIRSKHVLTNEHCQLFVYQ